MAHRPLTSRRGSASLVLVLVVLGLLLTAGGIGVYIFSGNGDTAAGPMVTRVNRSDFLHDVVEAGEVESSENVEVRCEVKARNSAGTAILEVVPEGTMAKAGDVLVRLDSSALEQELLQEQIILNNKEAAMIQARNLWEAAQLAKKEYVGDPRANDEDDRKGTFHVEQEAIKAEIFVAEENLRRAEEYARFSERLAAKGYVTSLQLQSDRFAVEKAKRDLEAARTKLRVLNDYTQQKMLRQLEADIKSAEAAFRAEESSYALQKERIDEINKQIEACTLIAPQHGQVIHANERDRRGNTEFVVEPGAMVRERQVIIRLPNSNKMQVRAKISESKISLVREGMPATVTIDAFDETDLKGVVTKVNEYPEPTSWFNSSVKEYLTLVEIKDPPENLRSGLTAKVRIHTQRIPDALQVPIQAVYRHRGRYYCFVPDQGGWQPQSVKIGASNERYVVIEEGLSDGDSVALNPAALLDVVDLPDLPEPGAEQIAAADAPLGGVAASPGGAAESGPRPAGGQPPQSSPSDAAQPSAGQIVSMIFSRSDTDGDGRLSEDEMPERFRGNFSAADGNGDGFIDRAELTSVLSSRLGNRPPGGPPASPSP